MSIKKQKLKKPLNISSAGDTMSCTSRKFGHTSISISDGYSNNVIILNKNERQQLIDWLNLPY